MAQLAGPRPDVGAPTAGPPRKNRQVFDAQSGSTLPGVPVRAEGEAATGDAAADEAYDGLGATWDLYFDVYERNSIDDAGMDLIASVHYLRDYDNAYWNGSQMVFGDGDGTVFNRFTLAVDVIGHELTHGVTGGDGEPHLPGPARRAQRVGLRRVRLARQAVRRAPAADRRRGGLADRRRPVHAERQRRRAAVDEGAGHRVRRPGARRQGPAAEPHGRLRRRRRPTTAASTSTPASRTTPSTSSRSRSAASRGSGPGASGTRPCATRRSAPTRSSPTSPASPPPRPTRLFGAEAERAVTGAWDAVGVAVR